MLPRRFSRPAPQSSFTDSERHLILAAESLRGGDQPAKTPRESPPEERISLFWRIFGGTMLSICALVMINAYQSLANSIHEVRGDLGRLRESAGDWIRKDDFNTRTTTLWNALRDLQIMQSSVSVLTNKLNALEQQAVSADRDHKELAGVAASLTALRDKDTLIEKIVKDAETERKELSREILLLRERLAKLEGLAEKKPPP